MSVYKGNRVARRIPLGIEHQCNTAIGGTGRHFAEGVGISFAPFVVIPAAPCVVTIHSALCLGRCPVVSIARDGRIILYILDRPKLF